MSNILDPTTYSLEQLKNPKWRDLSTAGTAQADRWLRFDNGTIRLIPGDYNSSYYLIGYVQMPVAMTAPTSTADVRIYTAHQEYLKFPAAAHLLMNRGDEMSTRLAEQYLKIFDGLISSTGVVQ